MKTVLINGSPKKRLSVSGFLQRCMRLFLRGEKVCLPLRTKGDHAAILQELVTADQVIFFLPLYVDGIPSHVLPFLKSMESFCRENGKRVRIYAVANNGFIEGRQNEPLMQVLENFCTRSGNEWCGGVGIGGGVMLNVMRIMFLIELGVYLLNILLALTQGQAVTPILLSFGKYAAELALLCCGILAYMLRLAHRINRGTDAGKKYTRIMLPSFVFILAADIFFIIISVFHGGVLRGWFKKHRPDETVV